MSSKYFTLLAAVVVTAATAFGQVSTAHEKSALSPAQLAQIKAFHTAPMRRATGVTSSKVSNGAFLSYNWGGYAVTGTDFTDVKGSWVVPSTNCAASPNAWLAQWVGIDGANSGTVEQTGIAVWCDETTPVYYAWVEFFPNPTQVIERITVTPGDTFYAEVSYSNSTQDFTVLIKDETTGDYYTESQAVPGAARSSAEWIAEAPSFPTGILNLADYGTAYFGANYTAQSPNEATDSTTTGVIKSFGSAVEKIYQIDYTQFEEQGPSTLANDGSSFYMTWVEYN
jgi:hypothetical protein